MAKRVTIDDATHYERTPCSHKCAECENEDHHWVPDVADETGDPIMACKHCEATRPWSDDDDDLGNEIGYH